MNYVKHLSIALLLVLGSVSLVEAAAPAKKVALSIATPGKTAFVKDATTGVWSHPDIKVGGKRENHVFDVDAATGVPTLKDDKGADVVLTVVYEGDVTETALKKFIRTNILEQEAKYKYGIPAAILGAGVGAYFLNKSFKDGVDNAAVATSDFLNDVKDGNGNARRNFAIGFGVAVAATYGTAYAYQGKCPIRG